MSGEMTSDIACFVRAQLVLSSFCRIFFWTHFGALCANLCKHRVRYSNQIMPETQQIAYDGPLTAKYLDVQVTAHFSPVLHHFFLETFRHPAHWFERRLQYTRSVAVNSMAGIPRDTYLCMQQLAPSKCIP